MPHVYGYASLGEKKAIITLRNPSDRFKTFTVYPDELLEMPDALRCRKVTDVKTVYRSYPRALPAFANTADCKAISLQPFEVIVMELAF